MGDPERGKDEKQQISQGKELNNIKAKGQKGMKDSAAHGSKVLEKIQPKGKGEQLEQTRAREEKGDQ